MPDRAREGRLNAKGIPCLYLSTDLETAMSEVRPWIGSKLTVAQFQVLKDLEVVDCSSDQISLLLDDASRPRKWERAVWTGVNRAFSEPVSPSDDIADYAPTQVLAESFREAGYAGVAYRSTLGQGVNIAVFDPALARVIRRMLFDVTSIQFGFSHISVPVSALKRRK